MGNAEFVLLPSICYEGCSMTVIEAFSLGKPVIATDIGFMHEAISAVGMNTVFPMKDYNALRHKVIELWNDPDLCSQYGKIARNEYENKYSEPIDIANLTKIYYNCISENTSLQLDLDAKQGKSHSGIQMVVNACNFIKQNSTDMEDVEISESVLDRLHKLSLEKNS